MEQCEGLYRSKRKQNEGKRSFHFVHVGRNVVSRHHLIEKLQPAIYPAPRLCKRLSCAL